MFYNESTARFALDNCWPIPELFSQDRPAELNVPLARTNKSLATSTRVMDADRLNLSVPSSSPDLNQLVQELACLYQLAWTAYERSQTLQAVVRPFLSRSTWTEATKVAWQGQQVLPTETREVSMLRLDIVNFTELIDNHPLGQVLADLNAYLDRLTRIVYRHQGDVDKYLGDGFLSIFDKADDAVQAGCALQQAVTDFNRRQSASGGLIFPARVAICTGQVVITTIGSPDRQDRTIMGMPINLVERLQAQATPGRVWLSQATFDRLRDPSGCRYLGRIKVKGRQEPVVVYEK